MVAIILIFLAGWSKPMLSAHNVARARFGAPPLVWSDALAAEAQQWASTLVQSGQYGPRRDSDLGQNLYEISGGEASPNDVVSAWMAEQTNYDARRNVCKARCGHFTQVVWSRTRQVGCGMARNGRRQVLACLYAPHGNTMGESPFTAR